MLRANRNFVHIHPILEPPFIIRDLNIISAHLPFPHPSVLLESPIFKTVTSVPLSSFIVVFVPKLDCNLLIVCQEYLTVCQAVKKGFNLASPIAQGFPALILPVWPKIVMIHATNLVILKSK